MVVLTDRTQVPPGRTLVEVMTAVADVGLRTLLLRETDLPDDERATLADHAQAQGLEVVAAHRAVPGCVGLHLPASAARPLPAGPRPVWGRSCHRRAEVHAAAAGGASWATLSPYDLTESKPGHGPPLPPTAFEALPIPVFALGGITPSNAAAARAAGAWGVAVMGAVMRAADPGAVVADLLREAR